MSKSDSSDGVIEVYVDKKQTDEKKRSSSKSRSDVVDKVARRANKKNLGVEEEI